MRGLLTLVVAMGVLIVAGVAVVAATILHRMAAAPHVALAPVLAEPAGTHILAASATAERLTITLQGGGPDRVAIIDLASGRKLAELRLSQ